MNADFHGCSSTERGLHPEVMGAFSISERIASQLDRIEGATQRAGRRSGDVVMVAASKKQSVEVIREAYAAGQRDFGENYVQELTEKAAALVDLPDLRWHMIGHLQTNKCRAIASFVHRVHTIDSLKLATELSKRIGQAGREALAVFVEVNVAQEASKSGCALEEVVPLVAELRKLQFVYPVGLMTMPPFGTDPEEARPYFQRLREFRDAHPALSDLKELSIGMSDDAEVAVECGATHVRIGTALFGPRPPLRAPEGAASEGMLGS